MKQMKFSIITILSFLYFSTLTFTNAFSAQNEPSAPDPVTRQYHQWLEQKATAIPDLKKALEHKNWRMRTHALIAMGKTGDKTLIPLIMNQLKTDPNISVRNCAVIALTDLAAASTALPYFLVLLDNGDITKDKAVSQKLLIESLGKLKDPRAVIPLYEHFFAKNRIISLKVVNALISIGDPSISHLILKEHEKIEKHELSRHAARILGELPVSGAEKYLIQLFKGKNMVNKTAAAIALGQIRSTEAASLFIKTIKACDKKLLKTVSNALVKIDSPDAVPPLCLLLTDKNPLVAMTSADILSRMSVPTIPKTVFKIFKTNDSSNAPTAYILGRKKYTEALPLMKKRLIDINQTGQDEMAQASGWMEDRASIPLLIKIAQRNEKQGSSGAIWSLGRLKATEAVPVLIKLLDKRDKYLMSRIISAMGNISDKKFIQPLTHLYYETGHQYSLIIGNALGNIGGSEVIEFIKDNIDSDDAERRKVAGSVLARINDRRFIPYFITLIDHKDRMVKRYAVQALQKSTGQKFRTAKKWNEWLQANPLNKTVQ
ncbi:HEAT repeat domain-containing protein [Desulfobacterales bacterium HSG16]|nr:HEAT repeat domain-containing protein [Desulfobacterales bacterium HSG16]